MWTTKNLGAKAGGKKTGSRGTFTEPRDATPTLAERRLGELLKETEKRGPQHSVGGGSKGSKREPLPTAPPTLADQGIDKKLSSRFGRGEGNNAVLFRNHIPPHPLWPIKASTRSLVVALAEARHARTGWFHSQHEESHRRPLRRNTGRPGTSGGIADLHLHRDRITIAWVRHWHFRPDPVAVLAAGFFMRRGRV